MPGPDPRAAVRVGNLDRTLDNLMSEVGMRTGLVLEQYHALKVAPLEARIAALETPVWRRLWNRLRRRGR